MRTRWSSLALALSIALSPLGARADEPPAAPGTTPAAAAAPPVDAAADALASELRSPQTGLASLKVYGFADFSYQQFLVDEKNSWWSVVPHDGAFSVGNLNLYLDAQLGAHARSLVELRFTYLPNGQVSTLDPSTGQLVTNGTTGVRDYTRAGFDVTAWGGVVIERAFVEWTFADALTLRAGQFLTPYGIWNVDHGSPVIVPVQRPYVINAKLMPEHQVGLEAYGTRWLGSARLGYHLTLSNGRFEGDPLQDAQAFAAGKDTSHVAPYVKYDGKFGVGGRVWFEGDWLGDLRVGASIYSGRFTRRVQGFDLSGGSPVPMDEVAIQYDETVYGVDARWTVGAFLAQGEWLWQDYRYTQNSPEAGKANGRSGGYLLLGWRLPYEIMPFVTLQYYDQDHSSRPDFIVYGAELGLNVHVLPNLVLKGSYSHYEMPHAPDDSVYASPLRLAAAQVAWAF